MDSPADLSLAAQGAAVAPSPPSLPPALAVLPGPRAGVCDEAGRRELGAPAARELARREPVMVAHAGLTARRLGLDAPTRSPDVFDVLELFAFVRPAQFCAPSPVGLTRALGLPEPKGAAAQGRLEAALARLEARVKSLAAPPHDDGGQAAQLRAELDQAHLRERQLEQAAAEASAALGRAAAEVRAALSAEV